MTPIVLTDLLVEADGRRLLGPISCTLDEMRIGIIGANGSGKTTLLRTLMGLTVPSAGVVEVAADGAPAAVRRNGLFRRTNRSGTAHSSRTSTTRPAESSGVRSGFGMLFSNPDIQLLMPTVAEDIQLSRNSSQRSGGSSGLGLGGESLLAAISNKIAPERAITTLSAGEKQLVALASTLAAEPNTLVCDEPGAHLDLGWRLFVHDLLLECPQRLIIATHDLDLAARLDRVIVLESGGVYCDSDAATAISAYRELAARHVRQLAAG